MTVKYCVSCAGCVRIFEKPLLYFIFLPYRISKKNREEGDKNKEIYREFHKNLTHLTHPTQGKAYLKKLQLYIIFIERPVSSLILSTGLYFLLKNGGKTMADVMVKILMKGAKAIGKTAVILIIWIAHKLENK